MTNTGQSGRRTEGHGRKSETETKRVTTNIFTVGSCSTKVNHFWVKFVDSVT